MPTEASARPPGTKKHDLIGIDLKMVEADILGIGARWLVGLAKTEASTCVVLGSDSDRGRLNKAAFAPPLVRDKPELYELNICERCEDLIVAVHTVSVEANAGTPDRDHKKKFAIWRKHPRQLPHGLDIAAWVERIAVSSQSNMFYYVHAGNAGDAAIGKREREEISKASADVIQPKIGRPIVIMLDRHEGRHDPDEVEA